jgi:hypothetical protein
MTKAYRFPFETSVERDGKEIDVSVIYSVTPYVPATYWQPAEGLEVELISVKRDGKEFNLTDKEEGEIIEECERRALQDIEDECAAEADWRYQEYRDRQLMEKWERDDG